LFVLGQSFPGYSKRVVPYLLGIATDPIGLIFLVCPPVGLKVMVGKVSRSGYFPLLTVPSFPGFFFFLPG